MPESVKAHKTAIRRNKLSRPLRVALRDGILVPGMSVLDYGCGTGEDADFLLGLGYKVQAWDPYYRPSPPPAPADLVLLAHVLNVIEDPVERCETLLAAFRLAKQVLIVAANMNNGYASKHVHARPRGDGLITSRGTFQKLYSQKELRSYLDLTTGKKSAMLCFGTFMVTA